MTAVSIGRSALRTACRAPHGSMYFDQRGRVRACCQHRGEALGDIRTQGIREIWDGAATASMREDLLAGTLPSSCTFCAWQLQEGSEHVLFSRGFDDLPVEDAHPTWPTQMEFALTNTCNLQCTMCTGEFSSSIRAQREGRPPLPAAYGDAFFEELREFLPHLTSVRFFGGEPLLGREPMRVLELLAELPDPPRTTLTTNATIWNPRVERVLRRLRPEVVVSLDGATPATFDRIRVGAHLPDVAANVERYREATGPDRISYTTCLMVANVHEFVDLVNLASAQQVHLGVNVVHHPPEQSLYHLEADELARVVDGLDRRRPEVAVDRRALFDDQVEALRNRLAVVRDLDGAPGSGLPIAPFQQRPGTTSRWTWLPFPEQGATATAPLPPLASGVDLEVGTDGVVRVGSVAGALPAAVAALDGGPIEDLFDVLDVAFGPMARWEAPTGEDAVGDVRTIHHQDLPATSFRMVLAARRDGEGRLVGACYRIEMDDAARARYPG